MLLYYMSYLVIPCNQAFGFAVYANSRPVALRQYLSYVTGLKLNLWRKQFAAGQNRQRVAEDRRAVAVEIMSLRSVACRPLVLRRLLSSATATRVAVTGQTINDSVKNAR